MGRQLTQQSADHKWRSFCASKITTLRFLHTHTSNGNGGGDNFGALMDRFINKSSRALAIASKATFLHASCLFFLTKLNNSLHYCENIITLILQKQLCVGHTPWYIAYYVVVKTKTSCFASTRSLLLLYTYNYLLFHFFHISKTFDGWDSRGGAVWCYPPPPLCRSKASSSCTRCSNMHEVWGGRCLQKRTG